MSGHNSRILLPLPVPSPLAPTASRSSTSSGTYESIPPPSVGPPPAIANSTPTGQRLSPDSSSGTRLPSITPDGLLIEAGARERSPPKPQRILDSTTNYGQDRLGALPTSPTSHTSHGGWLDEPHPGRLHADGRKRSHEATVFPWLNKPSEATIVQN